MNVIKPEEKWGIQIQSNKCPYLYYPANYYGCRLRSDIKGDNLCKKENCLLKAEIYENIKKFSDKKDEKEEDW